MGYIKYELQVTQREFNYIAEALKNYLLINDDLVEKRMSEYTPKERLEQQELSIELKTLIINLDGQFDQQWKTLSEDDE